MLTITKREAMILEETILKAAYVIEPERINDARGFLHVYGARRNEHHGSNGELLQSNIGLSHRKGTF